MEAGVAERLVSVYIGPGTVQSVLSDFLWSWRCSGFPHRIGRAGPDEGPDVDILLFGGGDGRACPESLGSGWLVNNLGEDVARGTLQEEGPGALLTYLARSEATIECVVSCRPPHPPASLVNNASVHDPSAAMTGYPLSCHPTHSVRLVTVEVGTAPARESVISGI